MSITQKEIIIADINQALLNKDSSLEEFSSRALAYINKQKEEIGRLVKLISIGWQPIETAPENEGVLITDGREVRYAFDTRRHIDYDRTVSRWLYHDYPDSYNTYVFDNPTHWMPLPKPINNKTGGG